MADYIASNTTADHAPDRNTAEVIGGVVCHYAVMANLGNSRHEQQDRASVSVLPKGTEPSDFKGILEGTFALMKERHDALKKQDQKFIGDCCVTMLAFDPASGMLAIGSKGDAPVYLVMRHKQKEDDLHIKRISSPHVRHRSNDIFFLNAIGYEGVPIMWAQGSSWHKESVGAFIDDYHKVLPVFELLDVRNIADEIIRAGQPGRIFPRWLDRFKNLSEKYQLSLLVASDGIVDADQKKEKTLRAIAEAAVLGGGGNNAYTILANISDKTLGNFRSRDNLSAILLPEIRLGSGKPIIACVCDGNYNGVSLREHDGSVAAQAMIAAFEQQMGINSSVRDEEVRTDHLLRVQAEKGRSGIISFP